MADFAAQFKKQITRDEGRRNLLYLDSLGIPTVGIGRNLRRPLSDDEVDYLYTNDFFNHKKEMLREYPWMGRLDDARFGAMLNMFFNLGADRFAGFKNMLRDMGAHNWKLAAAEALASKWAGQVGARAQRIAKQIETGEWQ